MATVTNIVVEVIPNEITGVNSMPKFLHSIEKPTPTVSGTKSSDTKKGNVRDNLSTL